MAKDSARGPRRSGGVAQLFEAFLATAPHSTAEGRRIPKIEAALASGAGADSALLGQVFERLLPWREPWRFIPKLDDAAVAALISVASKSEKVAPVFLGLAGGTDVARWRELWKLFDALEHASSTGPLLADPRTLDAVRQTWARQEDPNACPPWMHQALLADGSAESADVLLGTLQRWSKDCPTDLNLDHFVTHAPEAMADTPGNRALLGWAKDQLAARNRDLGIGPLLEQWGATGIDSWFYVGGRMDAPSGLSLCFYIQSNGEKPPRPSWSVDLTRGRDEKYKAGPRGVELDAVKAGPVSLDTLPQWLAKVAEWDEASLKLKLKQFPPPSRKKVLAWLFSSSRGPARPSAASSRTARRRPARSRR